jgi:AcrR family transcriptional regulator
MPLTEEAPRTSRAAGRQALVEAAIRVVGEGGLRSLTYREVAREAGVTQGLVSHHFGSWSELVRAALEHASRTSLERSPLQPPPQRLSDISAGLAQRVAEAPGEEAFQFEIALEARRRPDLAPVAAALYDGYLTATANALDTVGVPNDPDLARLVFAAIDGLAFQQLVTGEPEGTARSLEILHELLATVRDRERSS